MISDNKLPDTSLSPTPSDPFSHGYKSRVMETRSGITYRCSRLANATMNIVSEKTITKFIDVSKNLHRSKFEFVEQRCFKELTNVEGIKREERQLLQTNRTPDYELLVKRFTKR